MMRLSEILAVSACGSLAEELCGTVCNAVARVDTMLFAQLPQE